MLKSNRHFHASFLTLALGMVAVTGGCATKPPPEAAQTSGLACPQWVKYPADHHSMADSPYLGCVSQANLRAMVANPADLESGRQLGSADGERETLAVEAYEKGKVKAFQGSSASGATSSQVASSTSGSSGGQ